MKKNRRGRNCKDGLSSGQEKLARKIRSELLDDGNKKVHYESLITLWREFSSDSNNLDEEKFCDFVKERYPELHSAFKRLDINIIKLAKDSL